MGCTLGRTKGVHHRMPNTSKEARGKGGRKKRGGTEADTCSREKKVSGAYSVEVRPTNELDL